MRESTEYSPKQLAIGRIYQTISSASLSSLYRKSYEKQTLHSGLTSRRYCFFNTLLCFPSLLLLLFLRPPLLRFQFPLFLSPFLFFTQACLLAFRISFPILLSVAIPRREIRPYQQFAAQALEYGPRTPQTGSPERMRSLQGSPKEWWTPRYRKARDKISLYLACANGVPPSQSDDGWFVWSL